MVGGTITIIGEVRLRTGTRIGTSEEEFEIGGLDNPVIKDPVTGRPYIPGSSLKGRSRALFELLWMAERNIDPDVFFGGHHNKRHECGWTATGSTSTGPFLREEDDPEAAVEALRDCVYEIERVGSR